MSLLFGYINTEKEMPKFFCSRHHKFSPTDKKQYYIHITCEHN